MDWQFLHVKCDINMIVLKFIDLLSSIIFRIIKHFINQNFNNKIKKKKTTT